MILVALGSNQSGPWGNPRQTVRRALKELDRAGVRVLRASRLMISKAFGVTDQPDFVNAVAKVKSDLDAAALLGVLHGIEKAAGRVRKTRWGPRTLDLDLVDYQGSIRKGAVPPVLPHPGIAERLFVLKPIAEIAPGWVHPVLRKRAATLIRLLPSGGAGDEA